MPFIQIIKVNSMNTKTKYLIPAIAAVFALAFVFATPYVIAEEGDYPHAKWGDKSHKMHKLIEVTLADGKSWAIPLHQEFNKDAMKSLKDDISVSLVDAANAAQSAGESDIMMAHIGIVNDQNGNKGVAWILSSMNMDEESQIPTANIFVVDAGDVENTAKTTKQFDPSMHDRKMNYKMHDKAKFQDLDEETKAELKAAFQSLKDARASGDQAQIDAAKANLKSIFESIKAQN